MKKNLVIVRHPGPDNYDTDKSYKYLKENKFVCKIGSSQRK